jgi:hypothetical protein
MEIDFNEFDLWCFGSNKLLISKHHNLSSFLLQTRLRKLLEKLTGNDQHYTTTTYNNIIHQHYHKAIKFHTSQIGNEFLSYLKFKYRKSRVQFSAVSGFPFLFFREL